MQFGMTLLQTKVYDFIRMRIKEKGLSPTQKEIKDAMGFKSASQAQGIINALVKRGHLAKATGLSRSLVIVPHEQTVEIQAALQLQEVKNIIGDFVAAQDAWQSFFKKHPEHPDNSEIYAPRVQRHFEKLKALA